MTEQGIGFVGLGVMGEPMCRHLARKSASRVIAHDLDPAPLARLAPFRVERATSLRHIAETSTVVFLALPSGTHVEEVSVAHDGLLAHARAGQIIVDLGTSPVAMTKRLAADFAAKSAIFCDAPIARTRRAAEDGALSVMVGADQTTFAKVRPLLTHFARDITHCGPTGSGQVVKLMNNMVLMQTVIALAEALTVGRASGLDPAVLFDALSKGSADSFALRNHGMKAILPGAFPERAFSTRYALKDIDYALALAGDNEIAIQGATRARALLADAIEAGHGDQYWPVISKIISKKMS